MVKQMVCMCLTILLNQVLKEFKRQFCRKISQVTDKVLWMLVAKSFCFDA